MAGLDTKLETLLEIIELLVCKGDITNCNPILEGKGALAEAGCSGVFLGDAHGVTVELLGQITAQGQAIRKAE